MSRYTVKGTNVLDPGGNVVHIGVCEAAYRKKDHPDTAKSITDDDILLVKTYFGEKSGADLRAARELALNPPVAKEPTPAAHRSPVLSDELRRISEKYEKDWATHQKEIADSFERAEYERTARESVAAQSPVVIGLYDSAKYLIALKQFEANPAGLTDGDLEQFAEVDPDLAAQARAARAGYVPATLGGDEAEHFKTLPVTFTILKTAVQDAITKLERWIQTVVHLGREAHARIDCLEPRLAAAEKTILATPPTPAVVAKHESRLGALEKAHFMKLRGPWIPNTTFYEKGDVVMFDNALWTALALATKSMTPGVPARDGEARNVWHPIVKGISQGSDTSQELKSVNALAAELQDRLEVLEARQYLHYEGIWRADKAYEPGAQVTDYGGLWICHKAVLGARPGGTHESSRAWQLISKASLPSKSR